MVLPAADTRARLSVPCTAVTAALVSCAGVWEPTRSAFRPVATPVAFVVNGLVLLPPRPAVIVPASEPAVRSSKARPVPTFLERAHGYCFWGVPPGCERQPKSAPPPP